MFAVSCAQTASAVWVAHESAELSASVARCALKNRWQMIDPAAPGAIKRLLTQGCKVLVIQLGASCASQLALIAKLTAHWNPVRCIVVGPKCGNLVLQDVGIWEKAARQHGAVAWLEGNASLQQIEEVAASMCGAIAEVQVRQVTAKTGT
jgi:hypothetical protein